jgi:hypothetical protein
MSIAMFTGNTVLNPVDVSAITANWTVTYSGDLPDTFSSYGPIGYFLLLIAFSYFI